MPSDTTASEEAKKTPKTAAPKPQTIEVDKSRLDDLLGRLEKLEKDNKMLVETADKARVQRYNDLTATPIIHTYRLRTFKGQLVVGWRSVLDEMFRDGNGIWHERQQVEIVTEDGKTYTLPFLESERLTKVPASHVATETSLVDGQETTMLTLKLSDGRQVRINHIYVN